MELRSGCGHAVSGAHPTKACATLAQQNLEKNISQSINTLKRPYGAFLVDLHVYNLQNVVEKETSQETSRSPTTQLNRSYFLLHIESTVKPFLRLKSFRQRLPRRRSSFFGLKYSSKMSAAPAHTAKDRKRMYDLSGFVVLGEDAQVAPSPHRPRGTLKSEAKVFADRLAMPSPRAAKVLRDIEGCGTVLVQLPPSLSAPEGNAAPDVEPVATSAPSRPIESVALPSMSSVRSYATVTPAEKAARYLSELSIKDPRELRAHSEASHFTFGGPVPRSAAGASAAAAGLAAARTRSSVPVTVSTDRVPSHMQSERAFRHLRSTVDVLHMDGPAAPAAPAASSVDASRRSSVSVAAAGAGGSAGAREAWRPSRDVAVAMKADLLRSHFSLSHGH